MPGIGNVGNIPTQFTLGESLDKPLSQQLGIRGTEHSARADSALGGRTVGAGSGVLRETLSHVFSGIKDSFTKFFGMGRHADSATSFLRANPQLAPLMRVTEAHEGLSHKIGNAFSSIGRFILYTFSFINTRNPDNDSSEGVERSGAHAMLQGVERAIAQSHTALGDDFGIERRGVEVHLSYVPISMGGDEGRDFLHDIPLD